MRGADTTAPQAFERFGVSLPAVQREKIGRVWQHSRMGFALAFVVAGILGALAWRAPEGLIVSALAAISAVDAAHQCRHRPWREPVVSLLIDTGVMFLAMSVAHIPEAALGIPFAYMVVASMLLLHAGPAALVILFAGVFYAVVARTDAVSGATVSSSRGLVSGIVVDVVFLAAIVALIRVVFLIMNRDRAQRVHRVRIQDAIAKASRALLSGVGEDSIEQALQALLDSTGATAVFLEKNVDDADLGLCSALVAEVLKPETSPDPKGTWDLVPWSEMSGREALESGNAHSFVVSELRASERALYVKSSVRSELNLPVMVSGMWWGLIGFTDVYEERPWAKNDQYLLVTAAEMIGAYLERVQAREELDRRLNYHHSLSECATALQRTDDPDALAIALESLLRATEVNYASLDVNFEDPIHGPSYRIIHEARRPGERPDDDVPELLSGPHSVMPTATAALRRGHAVQIWTRDLKGREREIYEAHRIRSELCLPVMVTGSWHGSIAFADYEEERTFTALEIRILTTAVRMIGVFWERHQAKEALEHIVDSQQVRLRYESAIADSSRALLMSGDEEAVDVTVGHLMEATGAHSIFVNRNTVDARAGLVAEFTHELIRDGFERRVREGLRSSEAGDTSRVSRVSYADFPSLRVRLEAGFPTVVTPDTLLPSERIKHGRIPCKSELNIPIMAGKRWLGSIGFTDYETERAWGTGQIVMLQTVAEMIGAFWERNEDRKRLEELIRSKDEFVAAVSHELRTPLTSVVGLSHELRDRHREFAVEEAGDLMAVIADQSLEVADIIDDLLVSARADIGTLIIDPVPIDVADMLDGIMRTDLTAGFERVDIEGIQVAPFADPMRLRQILRNLIGNAARYGGERLRIVTSVVRRRAVITVADNGPGVSEDLAQTIFEPYARAHHVGTQPASVGLGLSVARDLARLMDGDIVYRRAESWAEFVVTLPLAGAVPGFEVADGTSADEKLASLDV